METRQLTVDDMMERRRWWWRWSGGGMWGRGGLQTGASALSHILWETLLSSPDVCGVCVCVCTSWETEKKNQFKANDLWNGTWGAIDSFTAIDTAFINVRRLHEYGDLNFPLASARSYQNAIRRTTALTSTSGRLSPPWQEGSNLNLFSMTKSLLKPPKKAPFTLEI